MIKFWTYKKEYKKIKKEILKTLIQPSRKDQYFLEKELETFEKNFKKI